MKILKFTTNIAGDDQVDKVAPFLDAVEGVKKWQIDSTKEDNILSLSGSNLDPQKIENALEEAGFTSEILRVLGTDGEGL